MKTTVNGIVLREAEYRENDKILTVLTDTMGLLTVTARGVRKIGSPLFSLANLFTYSSLVLNETKGRYYLSGGEPLELFYELRDDLEKLSLGMYMAEVTGYLASYEENCSQLLKLLCQSFYELARHSRNKWLVKSVFEEKICILSGIWPHFESCSKCGKYTEAIFYSPASLTVFCADCAGSDGAASQLEPSVLAALRYISDKEHGRAFAFALSESNLAKLNRITEAAMLTGLEREFHSLNFFKSIIGKS